MHCSLKQNRAMKGEVSGKDENESVNVECGLNHSLALLCPIW
jgi:hypothetical protein